MRAPYCAAAQADFAQNVRKTNVRGNRPTWYFGWCFAVVLTGFPQAAQSSHQRRRDNLQWPPRWRIGRAALE
jgi:hypothetical protein